MSLGGCPNVQVGCTKCGGSFWTLQNGRSTVATCPHCGHKMSVWFEKPVTNQMPSPAMSNCVAMVKRVPSWLLSIVCGLGALMVFAPLSVKQEREWKELEEAARKASYDSLPQAEKDRIERDVDRMLSRGTTMSRDLQGGFSVAEFGSMVGRELPANLSRSEWEKRVKVEILLHDPSYQLTDYDSAVIRSLAREYGK